jgi:DNA-binding transcriptional ArsR family regulator
MLEHLFGSKTRLKLLRTFFRDPVKAYYVRELTRILDVQINAIRRELELLVAAGLIVATEQPGEVEQSRDAGSSMRKYYRLNSESILYPELQALLIKGQALGEQEFVQEIRDKADQVDLLLLTGKFVNQKSAPSDLLVVGDLDEGKIVRLIAKYEKEFKRRYKG